MKVRVVSLGEMVVEIFAKELGQPFDRPGVFLGPYPSGAPAIFVAEVARLGCPSGIIATIGEDGFGDCLLRKLNEDGVDTSCVIRLKGVTTGTAFTSYNRDGTRRFIYHSRHAAPGHFSPQHLNRDYLQGIDYLHLTGNVLAISPSARDACYQAVEWVREAGGKISFDPNIRPEMMNLTEMMEIYRPVLDVADLLLPSEREPQIITGIDSLEEACRALLRGRTKLVAFKRGKDGATIFTPEEEFTVSPFQVQEVDPTGAGDCYDAAIIYGLLEGWDIRRTARFANAAGAFAVTRQGAMAATATVAEVEDFMRKRPGGEILAARN